MVTAMAKPARIRRIILRTIIGLALAAVVLAAAVKYLIAPRLMASALQERLAGMWGGGASAAGVEFSYRSPVHVGSISLHDANGREWLRLGGVTMHLDNWPSTKPVLTALEADDVALNLFIDSGQCRPPLIVAPPQEVGPRTRPVTPTIDHVLLRRITLSLDSCGRRIGWGDIHLSLVRAGDRYELAVRRQAADERLDLAGTVDGNLGYDLTFALQHHLQEDEGRELAAVLNFPLEFRAAGELTANMTARGAAGDLASLRGAGELRVQRTKILTAHGVLASDVETTLGIEGNGRLDFRSRSLSANLCGGKISGQLSAALLPGRREPNFAYSGDLTLEKVQLPELVRVLGSTGKMESGDLRATYSFGGNSFKTADLRARGAVLLRQADLRGLDLGREVFMGLGIDANIIVGGSRLRGDFTMQGMVIKVDKARLANNISALDAEPGGKVDIQKQTVDFYVVGAPLWRLRDLITSLPLVGAFSKVADKVTRVHVKGSWSDPPAKLVSKQPVTDLQAGTVEFFRAAVTTSGAGELLKALGGLIPGLGDGEDEEP